MSTSVRPAFWPKLYAQTMASGARKNTTTQAMGGSAVAKKASRRSCVWVAIAAVPVAPNSRRVSLQSRRPQARHRLVEEPRKIRAKVIRILAFGHDFGWREDHRI